jgi:hypothetical protein
MSCVSEMNSNRINGLYVYRTVRFARTLCLRGSLAISHNCTFNGLETDSAWKAFVPSYRRSAVYSLDRSHRQKNSSRLFFIRLPVLFGDFKTMRNFEALGKRRSGSRQSESSTRERPESTSSSVERKDPAHRESWRISCKSPDTKNLGSFLARPL